MAKNYYDLLDIPRTADDDQIRKAYFKAALKWHPDKNPDNVEVATEKFKLIAEAKEILSDPQNRAAYDHELNNPRRSHADYSQSGGGYGGGGGGGSGFFGFGFGFGSFGGGGGSTRMKTEEEMEWERKRQERANRAFEKARKQAEIDAKKDAEAAERRRIRDAEKAAKFQEYQKQKAKEEKEREQYEKSEAARLQQQEEEEARFVQEEKKRKQEENKLAKQARQRLRAIITSKSAEVDPDEIQEFMINRDATQLDKMSCQIESSKKGQEAQHIINGFMDEWKAALREEKELAEQQRMAQQKADAEAKAAAEGSQKAGAREWTTPELALFSQASHLFPGGYANRWKAIAEFMVHGGFDRSEKECVAKTQELKNVSMQKMMKPEPQADAAVNVENKPVETQKAATHVEQDPADESWTAEEQRALEAALMKHPASIPAKERWQSIAADVPGRTKKECVDRFKVLREKANKEREEMTRRKEESDKARDQKARDAKASAAQKEEQERQRLEREKRSLEKSREQQREKEERERAKKQEEEAKEARRRAKEEQEQERETAREEARRRADEEQRAAKMSTLKDQRASRSREVNAEELAENEQKRQDELVVLESVYGDMFVSDGEDAFTLRLGCSSEGECTVQFELPSEYPSLHPPLASFNNLPLGYDKDELLEQLEICFAEHVGEVMVYDWFELLKEQFEADGSFE